MRSPARCSCTRATLESNAFSNPSCVSIMATAKEIPARAATNLRFSRVSWSHARGMRFILWLDHDVDLAVNQAGGPFRIVELDLHLDHASVGEGRSFHRKKFRPGDLRSNLSNCSRSLFRQKLTRDDSFLAEPNSRDIGFIYFRHGVHAIRLAQFQNASGRHFLTRMRLHLQYSSVSRRPNDHAFEVRARVFDLRERG